MGITPNTRLPFGKYRGKKLNQCDKKYLEWMVKSFDNQDWVAAAKEELDTRNSESQTESKLEQDADAFLRANGVNPDEFK